MMGQTLNQRYKLEQLLAKGEYGSLFLATDSVSGETLSVRTLPAGTDLRGEQGLRFLRLVHRLEGEEHPNLLTPLETGTLEGTAYQALSYHPPETLSDLLRNSALSLADGVSLLRQVASALAHLHKLGIVHGGLAPYNIFVTHENGALRVALGDVCHSLLNRGEFPWGGLEAAPFRAPEEMPELPGEPDERADLYALGMIGYLVLAGRPPFTGVSVRQVLQRHLIEAAPSPREFNPSLPHTLSEILCRLTAKAPHERYQSAQGLLADLSQWESLPAKALARKESPQPRRGPQAISGRAMERDTILAALTRSASGKGSLQIVSGKDGSGKSFLFQSLMPHAIATGALVLRANLPPKRWCAPFQLPLALLADLLIRWQYLPPTRQQYLRGRLQQAIGDCSPILAEMLPGLVKLLNTEGEPAPLPRGKLHRRVLHALGEAFAVLADLRHPLVLWLGNLEFIDADSLAWLSGLAGRLGHTPIVIVGGIAPERTGEGNLVMDWLKRIGPNPWLHSMALPPLSRDDAAQLARLRLGMGISDSGEGIAPRISNWIHTRWGGNPLAHELVLATLLSRGHIRRQPQIEGHSPAGWRCVWEEVEALELPATVEELIAARCAPLSEEMRQVLECAAIFPEPFRLRELSALAEHLPLETLLEHVEGAIDQQILCREGGLICFAHRMFKTHFYLANATGRREHLHRLAGAMLEAQPSGAPLIHHVLVSRHFQLGGDTARARRHARAAADTALVQQGLAGAAGIYERAISRLEDSEQLPDLLVSLGTAQAMRGAFADALDSLYQACALEIPESLYLEALPLLIGSETARGEHEAALGLVEEALGLMETRLPGGHFGAALGRIAATARLRYMGLRTSAGAGIPEPLDGRERKIAMLFEQAALVLARHEPGRAVMVDEKLLQITSARLPAPVTVRAMIRLGEKQGDPEGQLFARAEKALDSYDFPHERALLAAARGRCHFNLLDLRNAKDELYLATELFRGLGDPRGAADALISQFHLARIQGPCGAVQDYARQMGELAFQLESEQDMLRARAMQAYGAGLSGKMPLHEACAALKALGDAALLESDLVNGRHGYFLAADLLMGGGMQEEALETFEAMPPRSGDEGEMLDFIIDAARAESHMLEAAVNEENRDWHQQQAWGLIDRVNEAQKIHPWLAMEVLGLDVMRLLLKGYTRQALELVESGEQVLEMQGARITMGRLCMRLAQGLKADGQSDWRDWAAKALSQFEMAGASPHASAARRMLELEPAAQTLAVQESSAASTAAHRAMDENSLAVQMLEHLGHALNGGDGGAADAMQRTFLRASMEAVNAEFGLLLLPDGLGRLASALSIPEHLGAPQQEIPQQEIEHQEIEQQETPHQETEQRKTAQQETEQPEKQQPREVNQWLVEQVWRQGKGEVMELFHPRSESAAGTAIGPEAQSAICIPLKSGETTHGVVYLGSAAERLRFDESDLSRVLRMARQAGTAVAYGAALESASGESRRVQAEISHLRDSAEWCPPAAAKQDCGEILKEYLDKCAAPAGFTGALLYWRKGDGAQLELGARASSGEELEFPAEYGVLDCWGSGRTAALALQSRRPMWMAQNPNDASDDSSKSMSTALDFRSGLWMPFPVSSDPAGVLLLTAPVELPRDLDTLGNSLELPLRLICPSLLQLRQLAGLDEAKAALQERAKKAEADNQRLARFVPAYLRGARTAKDDAKLIGEEKRLPVASGQIFGLGRLANVGKQETLAELQACYQKISEALSMHQGNLEQIMGDRWIAQYNGSVDSALWGVLTLIGNLTDFQEQRKASGLPELSFGIGLHLGDTIGGVLETDQRIEPVLVGEGVQVAARLAGMCRNFRTPVLVSDQTVQALDDVSPFDLRSLGLFRTAPGENRIGVYELYSTRSPEIRQAMRKHQGDWNAAMRHYRNGEWSDGAALFKAYLAKFPQDRPGRHFLRYCRQRAGQP